jgi:hypothetical protein
MSGSQNQQTLHGKVHTGRGHTVEDSSGHSVKEITHGAV